MPAPDYIPTSDAEFLAWSTNFFAVLNANLATVGLGAGDVIPLENAKSAYSASVSDAIAKLAVASAAIETKKTSRDDYQPPLRALVRRIQAHPGMTDALRAQLGITVPSQSRARRSPGPEIPGLTLETRPGQVILHFGTDPNNGQRNGKPAWAAGCNLYRKKPGDTEFVLIAFDTASPYVDTVTGPAVSVAYKAAYRGTRDTDEGGLCPEQTVAAGG